MIKFVQAETSVVETVSDCVNREPRVVLFSRETLFLRRSDNFAVPHQASGTVVVEGGHASIFIAEPSQITSDGRNLNSGRKR
jgi:hypothetical protein